MPELRMYEHDVCDFCSGAKPVRIFQSLDFIADNNAPALVSRGGWMACQACGEFIDAEKWDALQARSVAALAPKYSGLLPRKALVQQVVKAHSLFRQHMRRDA